MTTYFNFVPQPSAPFTFSPTLDGQIYTAMVTWNFAGQRWYLSLYAPDGTRLITQAVVGSPTGNDIESIVWNNGEVTVTVTQPHGLSVGTTTDMAVVDCVPADYNGEDIIMLVTSENTFTYPLASDPGPAAQFGKVMHDVDLAGEYFTSVLVFRNANQQFEVRP